MLQSLTTLGVFIGSLIAGGVGDGLNDRGVKWVGHLLGGAEIGIILASPFLIQPECNIVSYIVGYTALRIALFDPIYNLARGNKLTYIGDSSISDKIWKRFKMPPHGQIWVRAAFLVLGLAITILDIF